MSIPSCDCPRVPYSWQCSISLSPRARRRQSFSKFSQASSSNGKSCRFVTVGGRTPHAGGVVSKLGICAELFMTLVENHQADDFQNCRDHAGNHMNHFAMQTFFGSVKNRSASSPPSRPTPLCFIPPKGTRRSRTSQQFTQTVPVLIRSATRWARLRFCVQMLEERPYSTSLA